MLAFKDQGVKGNVDGVAFLLKKNKIDTVHGTGTILGPGKVEVADANGGKQQLETKSIVIATGSDVARLPGIEIDEQTIVSSTGALSLPQVPKRMLVVGAGVIGLELGSVWRRLGSEVLVVEFLDRILPGMDADVAKSVQRILMKQGMSFKLSSKVTGVAKNGAGHKVTIEPAAGAAQRRRSTPTWCWWRSAACPTRKGLGLEAAGVQARQQEARRGRCALPDQRARHLRHRRRHRRAHAGAQGRGRGHGRGRDPGRPGRPRELRRRSPT